MKQTLVMILNYLDICAWCYILALTNTWCMNSSTNLDDLQYCEICLVVYEYINWPWRLVVLWNMFGCVRIHQLTLTTCNIVEYVWLRTAGKAWDRYLSNTCRHFTWTSSFCVDDLAHLSKREVHVVIF